MESAIDVLQIIIMLCFPVLFRWLFKKIDPFFDNLKAFGSAIISFADTVEMIEMRLTRLETKVEEWEKGAGSVRPNQ